MAVIIRGGTVVTADQTFRADVLTEGETIIAVGENLEVPAGAEVVEAITCLGVRWMSRLRPCTQPPTLLRFLSSSPPRLLLLLVSLCWSSMHQCALKDVLDPTQQLLRRLRQDRRR